jgi:putative DNA methylase
MRRLIEKWFPVVEASVEASRERGGPNILPPIYFLHVYWTRKPLIPSRIASYLAVLPEIEINDEIRKQLLYHMGIKGDPLKVIGKRFDYSIAERQNPTPLSKFNINVDDIEIKPVKILTGADFMAGGGSIPFEMIRVGYEKVIAGEYNPVAFTILKASLEYPVKYGEKLVVDVEKYGKKLIKKLKEEVKEYYPPHPIGGQPDGYIWVKTVKCTHCGREIPILMSKWLDRERGYALYPEVKGNNIELHVVKVKKISSRKKGNTTIDLVEVTDGPFKGVQFETEGNQARGAVKCMGCGYVLKPEKVKEQYKIFIEEREAQEYKGVHPHKMVAVVMGGGKNRKYYEPTPEMIEAYKKAEEDLKNQWDELVAKELVPIQQIPVGEKTKEPMLKGIQHFYQLFNARQLLVHAKLVELIKETYNEILNEELRKGKSREEAEDYAKAIIAYLTLMLGKIINYNSTLTSWNRPRGVIRGTFDSHAYAWTWDYGEFDMLSSNASAEWALRNSIKALRGIVKRLKDSNSQVEVVYGDAEETTQKYKDLDVIFIDPPYYGAVQHGELSDYFYVWFRLILKDIYPEAYQFLEVPKSEEAVYNEVRWKKLAEKRYEDKIKRIFKNMRDALADDGLLLIWFAHKAGEAWIKTVKALLDAGYSISAMWSVRSEMERSLHIAGKAALRTSILFVCRKRQGEGAWLPDVMRDFDEKILERIEELESYGLFGPDLVMGAQAEALRIVSEGWPVKDPSGERTPEQILDEALNRAVGIVINHTLKKVAPHIGDVDAPTKFYVLAYSLGYGDIIDYDDARRIALALGTTEGDPVEEIVIKHNIGKFQKVDVEGKRTKAVKLYNAFERDEKSLKEDLMINILHRAIRALEDGESIDKVATILAKGGHYICEVAKALYEVLPEETKNKNLQKEKLRLKDILVGICNVGLHEIAIEKMEEAKEQKRLDEFIKVRKK